MLDNYLMHLENLDLQVENILEITEKVMCGF